MGDPLEVRQVQPTFFKNVLEAISSDLFSDSEATFHFSATGWGIQATDTNNVARVALFLPNSSEAFSYYCCDSNVSMGLNLADLAFFRCIKDDDIFSIKAESYIYEIGVLRFVFELPNVCGRSTFGCDVAKVIDNDESFEIQEHPESKYQAIVSMPSVKLHHICKKLSIFVDSRDRDTGTQILPGDL